MKTFSWLHPNLEVNMIPNCGSGIFASKRINKGEIVAIFGGKIFADKDRLTIYRKTSDWGLQISELFILGYANPNEIEDAIYINHSCNPNIGFKGQIIMIAIRPIEKEDQIVFDYATCLYSTSKKPDYILNCLCGSKNCRKIITSNDWKNPELQKKYKGFFQFYLQEKIDKLTKK